MIGDEAKEQILAKEGRLPDAVIACVGGGSNAIGLFTAFKSEQNVRSIGVEPAGLGIDTGAHGAPLKHGRFGIYFGMKSLMMQTDEGQIKESYSISAGLNFPSVGPERAYLNSIGRANYVSISDDEAISVFEKLSEHEDIRYYSSLRVVTCPCLRLKNDQGRTRKRTTTNCQSIQPGGGGG